MNFNPKILGLGVGIFRIVFPSMGSCLTNCFGLGTDVFRFVVNLELGLFLSSPGWKLGLPVDCVCCADV